MGWAGLGINPSPSMWIVFKQVTERGAIVYDQATIT
jgi:hypothetical protein